MHHDDDGRGRGSPHRGSAIGDASERRLDDDGRRGRGGLDRHGRVPSASEPATVMPAPGNRRNRARPIRQQPSRTRPAHPQASEDLRHLPHRRRRPPVRYRAHLHRPQTRPQPNRPAHRALQRRPMDDPHSRRHLNSYPGCWADATRLLHPAQGGRDAAAGPGWRWRESNPRPSGSRRDFSERSRWEISGLPPSPATVRGPSQRMCPRPTR